MSNHDFDSYFKQYIDLVPENNIEDALISARDYRQSVFENVDPSKGTYAYADGKWTINQVLSHLIDTERIFCYRALTFARQDPNSLPGYDHDLYATVSGANERDLDDILKEYSVVRQGTIHLYRSFTEEMLNRSGIANNKNLSVRAIGLINAGHERHHVNVIKERYMGM